MLERLALLLAGLTACAGPGPSPEQRAATLPPEQVLSDAQRASVASACEAALAKVAVGDFAGARVAAEQALAIDPRAAQALAARARCTMETARRQSPPALALWQQAEGDLRLATRLAPQDPEVALLHAELLEADGHLAAAAAALDAILATQPHHARCLIGAARLRYELGEERAALPLLLRWRDLDPRDPSVLYRIGQCQARLGLTAWREQEELALVRDRLQRAAATFAEYRQAVPDDGEAWAAEAFTRLQLLRVEHVEQAAPDPAALEPVLRLYERAAALLPGSPEPQFHVGLVLEMRGELEAARVAYALALERDPEHVPSLLNLAASLAAAGRVDDAKSYARRALALDVPGHERDRLAAFVASGG